MVITVAITHFVCFYCYRCSKQILAGGSFDLPTSGLWAQHASAAPSSLNFNNATVCLFHFIDGEGIIAFLQFIFYIGRALSKHAVRINLRLHKMGNLLGKNTRTEIKYILCYFSGELWWIFARSLLTIVVNLHTIKLNFEFISDTALLKRTEINLIWFLLGVWQLFDSDSNRLVICFPSV